ncbi:hypothetical protein [Endozoicomonas sp. 8E]|uniref:hypothetical protein n=1 Tax=Endozoicomonas sp. 8E TaxID=3035692 RepID=UPI002938D580|nr:hypothetical protein [Endozoicomonas sp. 8E]WOG29542.1 hypothetical protein P6910_07800 [Endozoicomonas sp. 8E]
MTNARSNALSLAVAIAISSSIIGTDALPDRRLQTKFVYIPGNEPVEFTQREAIVKPTLDDDSLPILKSFTTTYPAQAEARAGYEAPSEDFTGVLSGIEGGVSSVDLFETDENDAAQKYTKVLKVGNEGVFKFTHNLEDNKLVIEVREAMTHQASIEAVRAQLDGIQSLQPLTKVASPKQLVRVLNAAHTRAGNLGANNHYAALATIEADEVEVNGRTFMRLIAAGDPPPGLQSLGQTLFVNDEALFTAATLAYTQVHVLEENLQQKALTDLLSYLKPVGYVVHVDGETQAYPVPAGYPILEVTETAEEIIFFRGQKQHPSDVVFVQDVLYPLLEEFNGYPPVPEGTAKVKADKVKTYQYVIRSRQMVLLEELAAQHNTGLNEDGLATRSYEEKLVALAYYEAFQQALSSAAPDGADEFEFTTGHVRVVSSVITPTWMHTQLVKHFGFKPALKDLLANRYFVQDIHKLIPIINKVSGDSSAGDESFASKVIGDLAGQMLGMESELEGLLVREAELVELVELVETLHRKTTIATASSEIKPRVEQLIQQAEDELKELRQVLKETKNSINQLKQDNKRVPELEKRVRDARAKATNTRNTELAAELGIDNWDDTQPPEEQSRLIRKKIHEINQAVAATFDATGQPDKEAAIKARYIAIAAHLNIQDFDGNDDVDAQKERLLQKLKTVNAQQESLIHKLQTANAQLDEEDAYTGTRKGAPAAALAIERITAIENDLDRQISRPGPKPGYVLDRELATAIRALEKVVGLKPAPADTNERRVNAQRNKQVQPDSEDGAAGEIGQLIRELALKKQAPEAAIDLAELAAFRFFECDPGNLKTFSKYFATHSAIGSKIITLLHEGRYKHGIDVSRFKAVVRMLSDSGAEEFIQSTFSPVTVTTTGPEGMKESVDGMKEYAAAVIANYALDDIAFENGRKTLAFLTSVHNTLTPYANAAGLSESDLPKIIHDTLMQARAVAVEQQLSDYWIKPSAFLVQAVTWYYTSYKPLLVTHTARQAAGLSLSNMSFLYLLDLTNRGDYLHRMLTPFQHWLERFGVDLDRTDQYAFHSGIEQVSEVGGLAMPLGKAAASVILLRTGSILFARQYNANPHRYLSISRLVPEILRSMGSGQGVQVPLLQRVTPQKVKTLASATGGLVLGPIATVGSYVHGLIFGLTYAQTFGFALASSLTFDFFINDNKILTQWLGGPLGRGLDKMHRWTGLGETQDEYVKRTAIDSPQRFNETDEAYANRVKASNRMYGWTRHENYLQFRERRDRTIKLFENSWEKYFRENVPKWSFSHAESIPYSYTLGALYELQKDGDQKVHSHDKSNAPQSSFPSATSANHRDTGEHFSLPEQP